MWLVPMVLLLVLLLTLRLLLLLMLLLLLLLTSMDAHMSSQDVVAVEGPVASWQSAIESALPGVWMGMGRGDMSREMLGALIGSIAELAARHR